MATVQEKKGEPTDLSQSLWYRHTHTSTYYPTTCPLKFARFQLARSRFPDPCSTESGTSSSWLKNYRAEVTATAAPRNCRARRRSSQIKTIWGCNSTKRSRNSNTLSGRRGVRTEVEHCVLRAWDELDHTHTSYDRGESPPKQRSRQAYATRAQTNFLSSGYKEVKSRNKHASNSKQTHEKHAKKNDLNGATRASSICSCRYQTDAINKTPFLFFFQTALLP
uniref:Putative rho gtpase-activating protein rich2 n=1 Tax=Ixodes ricinus TaxID=34613 RepID=A0A6B0V445_IXORI